MLVEYFRDVFTESPDFSSRTKEIFSFASEAFQKRGAGGRFFLFSHILLLFSYGKLEKNTLIIRRKISIILQVNNILWYRPSNNDFLAITLAGRTAWNIHLTLSVENLIEKVKIQKN